MAKLFVSYRRDDIIALAGRIYDRLAAQFGRNAVFMDVDAIPFGVDFRQFLSDAVGQCDVLLAIIGEDWLNISRSGTRRLDDPKDFVRIEIEAALQRGIPVIPVLINPTVMPQENELPGSLLDLAYRHAATIDPGRDFNTHVDRIIRGVEHLLQNNSRHDETAKNPTQHATTQQSVNQFFDELLRERQRITYRSAYPILMGSAPDPFYFTHVTEVAHLAATSKQVVVDGLPIHLDALLVYYKTGEPVDNHFKGKPYSTEQWRSVFLRWAMR